MVKLSKNARVIKEDEACMQGRKGLILLLASGRSQNAQLETGRKTRSTHLGEQRAELEDGDTDQPVDSQPAYPVRYTHIQVAKDGEIS